MKAYRANGHFRAGRRDQPYTVDLMAESEEDAKERVYSNFGSRHRVSRRFVIIESVAEINPAELTSPVVVAHFADQ